MITPTFPFARFEHDRSRAGRAGRIIQRPQQPRLGLDERHNLFPVPDVIASGDDGNAGPQQIDRDFRRDASPGGGVLAVHDDEIDRIFLLQFRQAGDDRAAARLADDVAEEKNREHARDHRIKLKNPKLMFRSSRHPRLCPRALFLGGAPPPRVEEESPHRFAANLSTLGRKPDWSELEKYQATITHDEFVHLLNDVYCPQGYSPELIKLEPEAAKILTEAGTENRFVLHFAKNEADRLPVNRLVDRARAPYRRRRKGALRSPGFTSRSIPGHLGGTWAKMEERWFKIGDAAAGAGRRHDSARRAIARAAARVVRREGFARCATTTEPITPYRPSDFEEIARQLLRQRSEWPTRGRISTARPIPRKNKPSRWQRELLFYRNSEIRRRASLVNYRLQPDLVLCLHFNAEPWGDPNHPTLVTNNHLHLLVNGAYLPAELELDDERFEMLQKLLSRAFPEELALAETIAQHDGEEDRPAALPIQDGNATRVGDERIRLCAQPDGDPALPLPDGLPGALCDEQPGGFRAGESGRLRRRAVSRGKEEAEHLPRICGQRGRRCARLFQEDATSL